MVCLEVGSQQEGYWLPKNEESYFLYLRLQGKYEEMSKEI